jgi:RNA polymerase sigma-54 factor
MLELRQEQRLLPILTQQLQQAIKLLQLSQIELVEAIEQELNENPMLEVAERQQEEAPEEPPEEGDDTLEMLEHYSSSEEYTPAERDDKEYPDRENLLRKTSNLRDHLRWQAGLSDLDAHERLVAEWIIENIDDNGYLAFPIAEIARVSEFSEEALEGVLAKIQKLEPAGVGARDLKECILLQYEAEGERDPIFEHVLSTCFELFEKANLKDIARKTGYPLEKIKNILERIKSYDPKPGRNFADDSASPVVPDVYVVRGKEDFEVYLNDDQVPELRLSRYYLDLYTRKEAGGETRKYIRQKVKQAEWFIKSIRQRQQTLYRVAQSLVKFQREFLEQGLKFLKPLNLRDVAVDVGVHESTVSRVTTSKYISTPQGVYEMKFFFPTALSKDYGDALSTNVVMGMIFELVKGEDKAAPLTDEHIASSLKTLQSVNIARRTVVKYREILHIPSSRARRVEPE